MLTPTPVLLGCDKTRGHLNPALFLARFLSNTDKRANIVFYPVAKTWQKTVAQEGFQCIGKSGRSLRGPLEVIYRIFETFLIILKIKPRYAIGYGGRQSMWAIWLLSWFIPTAIYEPNASFGKANLFLALFVRKIFTGFPDVELRAGRIKETLARKITFTGIPLKESFFSGQTADVATIKKTLNISPSKKILLAFGGSSGASYLNNLVYTFYTRERTSLRDVVLIHLTGTGEYEKYRALYSGETAVIVQSFSEEMPRYYRIADALISRAGASSVAETAFFSIPSVLIPLPGAYAHQHINATYLSKRQGSYVLSQENLSYDDFRQKVLEILFDAQIRERMRMNLKEICIWRTPEQFAEHFQKNFFERYSCH